MPTREIDVCIALLENRHKLYASADAVRSFVKQADRRIEELETQLADLAEEKRVDKAFVISCWDALNGKGTLPPRPMTIDDLNPDQMKGAEDGFCGSDYPDVTL